jgi:thioredoxin reductase
MGAVYAPDVKRVIVIGAGPMGLEAALLASARGCDVTVLEQSEVGGALRLWGPTRCFSPFAMNASARARALLGDGAPPPDALLTGPEVAERVLLPLSRSAPLDGRVRIGHRVLAVGRARMRRDELAGHPLRVERPFRVLAATPDGERLFEADAVLDASGVYGQPLPLGAGGVPAPGERALGDRVIRHLGTLHARRAAWSGRRVLLVGSGHSAAHAVALLADGAGALVWAVRAANARPVADVADDPLPERAEIVRRANALAVAPPPHVTVERRAHVEEVVAEGAALVVSLTGGRRLVVDELVALTGYRPDLSIASELAIEVAPASEGAARLQRAIANVTDCLTVPSVSARDLESGEPGFALVGHKSYGRSRAFLLQTGLSQLETIVAAL